MQSSASSLSTSTCGTPYAASTFRTSGNCDRNSSGMSGRCALYAGMAARRSAGMPASKHATACDGLSELSTRASMRSKPYTALTAAPVDVVSGGNAKNAR